MFEVASQLFILNLNKNKNVLSNGLLDIFPEAVVNYTNCPNIKKKTKKHFNCQLISASLPFMLRGNKY